MEFIERLCRDVPVHPVTLDIARMVGSIEGEQEAKGIQFACEDLVIGVTALHLGYAVNDVERPSFPAHSRPPSFSTQPKGVLPSDSMWSIHWPQALGLRAGPGGGAPSSFSVLTLLSVFNRIFLGSDASCLVFGTLRFGFWSLPLRLPGVNVCG